MYKLFDFDKQNKTSDFLIGTDEAGRGPLAGPVVAAAVCFPVINDEILEKLKFINDSKQLTSKQRESFFTLIKEYSINAITVIDIEEIEKINILQASLKGMKMSCKRVIKNLNSNFEIFIDGNKLIPDFKVKQKYIVKGDATSASIAAASILAKVYRDNLMQKYAKQYPQYDFGNNKGYGTPKHIAAIKEYGVSPIHRQGFLKKILQQEYSEQLKLEL